MDGEDYAQMRRYNWCSSFDQPDPYGGSYNAADPQSLNRYSYVQNDPVNYVDPSGLNAESGGATFVCRETTTWDGLNLTVTTTCQIFAGPGGGDGEVTIRDPFDIGDDIGGDVQQEPPPRPDGALHMLDDCKYLAATADQLARENAASARAFVNAMRKRFVTPSNQDSPAMREFRAGGFLGRFNDDQGSYNQVRHFVGGFSHAYFGAAIAWGLSAPVMHSSGIASAIASTEAVKQANRREGANEHADRRLNGVSAPLGVRLAFGQIGVSEIGDFIRAHVCGSSW